MVTIVAITPVALTADSRTLKMAASLAAAGYRSIVAEGCASEVDFGELNIEVVPLYRVDGVEGGQCAQLANSAPEYYVRTQPILRQELSTLKRALRKAYHAALRTPLAPLRDFLTLYLHLKVLWGTVGLAAARKLPEADLYYVHAMNYAPAVWLRTVFTKKKVIYDAHDIYDDLLLASKPSRFVRRYVRSIDRIFELWLVWKANISVTTSGSMAQVLATKFEAAFEVIRNLHDARIDLRNGKGLHERLGLPSTARVIVSIGNVKEAHRFEALASELSKRHNQIHLVGIGAGYGRVLKSFRDAGVESCFHSLERVPARELVPTLKGADGAILPYVPCRRAYQVFLPNGFGQAVAAGLPILFPEDIPEIAELAEKHQLGWPINAENGTSISRALDGFLDLPQRKIMAHNVQEFSKEFSWIAEERKFLRLIEQALLA